MLMFVNKVETYGRFGNIKFGEMLGLLMRISLILRVLRLVRHVRRCVTVSSTETWCHCLPQKHGAIKKIWCH